MVPFKFKEFINELVSLVESGEVSIDRIDDAVERILRVKFVAGIFEYPFADRSLLDIVGSKVILKKGHISCICFYSISLYLCLVGAIFGEDTQFHFIHVKLEPVYGEAYSKFCD